MANIKEVLGAAGVALTLTLDSLVSSSTVGRASTAVDNTINLYLDALVTCKIVYPNLAPANDKAVYFYVYGTTDGTNYTDGITGTDAGFTPGDWGNLTLLGRPLIAVQNKTHWWGPFSVAAAFGGSMPAKWGVVVKNFSGQTLGTVCSINYQGVYASSI